MMQDLGSVMLILGLNHSGAAKEEIRKLLANYMEEMDEYWESITTSPAKHIEEYEDQGVFEILQD